MAQMLFAAALNLGNAGSIARTRFTLFFALSRSETHG